MKRKNRSHRFTKGLFILFNITLILIIHTLPLRGGEKMRISSSAFKEGDRIPLKYVMPKAGGQNLSPPLAWEGVPEMAKSLVLLCYDPHPIARNWVHWIVVNIPREVKNLPEGASTKAMPKGSRELKNSFGFVGYGGPQPPPGTGDHPYVFVLYAISQPTINLPENPSYHQVVEAIKPYVLSSAQITAYFGR